MPPAFCRRAGLGATMADVFSGTSFFGDQEGPFELGIISIAAVRTERYLDDPDGEDLNEYMDEKSAPGKHTRRRRGWFGGLFRCFGV